MVQGFGSGRSSDDQLNESAGELPASIDLFRAIGQPTMILDKHRNVVAVNGAVAKSLKIPASELIGRKCHEFFHRQNSTAKIPENCPISRGLKTGNFETAEMEVEAMGRTMLVSCTPVVDGNGDLDRIIHIATDVTAQRIVERQRTDLKQELLRVKKMESIGRLAGSIAHDFNNFLVPILAYSEMLTKDSTQQDPKVKGLFQIKNAAERAKELTAQLLAFSRKQVLELKPLNLNSMVTKYEALFKDSIPENISFHTKLAPKQLTLLGDITQLERVLMNFVSNAQQAMPSGGDLTIETDLVQFDEETVAPHPELSAGSYVVLSVTDTGDGIDEEILGEIFDPFFTTKEEGRGTGLGLSMAYGVVMQHDGKIVVTSTPGKGSVFKAYFPKRGGSAPSVEDPKRIPRIVGGKETVLVVEDDDSVRETLKHLLENLGYSILAARDGTSGLGLAKAHPDPIPLLLTDLSIPHLDGERLYQHICEFRPETKVLFMSGFNDETLVEQGFSVDQMDFLPKPFTIGVLSKKIRDKLDGIS